MEDDGFGLGRGGFVIILLGVLGLMVSVHLEFCLLCQQEVDRISLL